MNVKMISKALHALSLLSDEDYGLVLQLRALTEDERQMLTFVLEPQKKTTKKTTTERKIEHCVACDYTKRALVHKDPNADGYHEFQSAKGEKKASKPSQSSSKSPRASGMAAQLSSRREQQQKVNDGACAFVLEDGAICNTGDNNPIHDESFGYAHYHPFQPSTTAPPAPTPSPANGGVGSTTANSGTLTDDAGTVAHGASGRD